LPMGLLEKVLQLLQANGVRVAEPLHAQDKVPRRPLTCPCCRLVEALLERGGCAEE
jgi:hypothetical protein